MVAAATGLLLGRFGRRHWLFRRCRRCWFAGRRFVLDYDKPWIPHRFFRRCGSGGFGLQSINPFSPAERVLHYSVHPVSTCRLRRAGRLRRYLVAGRRRAGRAAFALLPLDGWAGQVQPVGGFIGNSDDGKDAGLRSGAPRSRFRHSCKVSFLSRVFIIAHSPWPLSRPCPVSRSWNMTAAHPTSPPFRFRMCSRICTAAQ